MLSISYTSICSKLIDKAITCHKVKQQVFHSSSVVFKISQIFRFGVVQTVDGLVCVTYITTDTAFSFSSHSFMICTHSYAFQVLKANIHFFLTVRTVRNGFYCSLEISLTRERFTCSRARNKIDRSGSKKKVNSIQLFEPSRIVLEHFLFIQ